MDERERLVDLLSISPFKHKTFGGVFYKSIIERIAEHLIKKGVIVPPVQIGDTVYVIDYTSKGYSIFQCEVKQISVESSGTYIYLDWGVFNPRFSAIMSDRFGKTVFLTKAEAEIALEGDLK